MVGKTGGRLTRSQTQALTRQRLLAAARTIVEREGSGAVTVSRVAEAAGYTTGAVYSNFKGGRAELLSATAREIAGPTALAMPVGDSTDAWLRQLTATLADHTDNRAAVALATEMIGIALRDPDVMDSAAQIALDSRASIAASIEESRSRLDEGTSSELAMLVMALFAGLAQYRALLGPDEVPLDLCARAFAGLSSITRPHEAAGAAHA